MRLFLLLRSLFAILLFSALVSILAHSQLCINYRPHDLQGLLKNCEPVIASISSDFSVEQQRKQVKEEADIKALIDVIEKRERGKRHVELFEADDEVAEWHKVPIDTQDVRVNVRTCFDFSLYEILNDSIPQYSSLVSTLRITLRLVAVSLLLAVFDMSSRLIFNYTSLVQSLVHSVLQIATWGYMLISMEVYRRKWTDKWLDAGQQPTEVPVYPVTWHLFELLAFLLIFVSMAEAILFRWLEWSVRLANSQGVYRCVRKE